MKKSLIIASKVVPLGSARANTTASLGGVRSESNHIMTYNG